MSEMAAEADFSNWMGQLPAELHNLPLNAIAIPGKFCFY